MKLLLSIVSLISLLQISTRAADERVSPHWPQWRGPSATGVAPLGNPPLKWAEGMNVKWKVELPGAGTSTPVVWGDNVFILTAIATPGKGTPEKDAGQPSPAAAGAGAAAPASQPSAPEGGASTPGAATANPPPADRPGRRRGGGGMRAEKPTQVHRFAVIALDRKTGKVRWEKTAREEVPHEAHHRDHGFASFSPVTDGESLYVSFGSRGLFCFDFSGKLKWQNDLGNMQIKNTFGEGSSPALHGNALVVNWDHEGDDFIVALDKRTGKELWRQPRDESTSWSTPLIVEHEGKAQVVVNATRRIRAYDLETGKELWECGGMTDNAIPTPVSAPGMVFVTSGFRGAALLAIKLGRTGDLTNTDAIAWRNDRGTPYVPSPLLYEDRLYFHSGNNGVVSCFHAPTGRPLFETQRLAELPGGVYASPVGAAGRVYLIGRDGNAAVIKHGDQLEVLASNKLDDRFDASPAIVGKEMFLRGHKHLYCIAEGAGSTAAR